MALTANLVIQTITGDGSTFVVKDQTTYGSGNPNRNQVALSFTAFKKDEELVETALTVDSFDPKTPASTDFTVHAYTDPNTDRIIDGWYKFYFMIVEDWDLIPSTTYSLNNVVWGAAQGAFYRYINASPSSGNPVTNPTYWVVVTNPANLIGTATQPSNVVIQVLETVISYQTSICFTKAASKHAKEQCSGADCSCDSRLGKLYHKIEDVFTNMNLNSTTQEYLQGEKNAREVERYCDDCGCLER